MPKGIKGFQKGHEVTKEMKENISKKLTGRKLSEEHRKKMIGRNAWNKGLRGEEYSKHYEERKIIEKLKEQGDGLYVL